MRFIVALLIASLFVDKANSELSFIPRHNLYPCASYSPGVRSQKYSHPHPLTSIPRASYPFSFDHGGGASKNRKTHIGFRDNQARTDDFHHVKVILYRWVISLPYPPSGRRTDFLIITYQRVERLNTTIPPFFFHSNDVFPPENEQIPFLGNTYIQDPSIIIEQKRKDPMQPLTTSYK